MRRRILEILVHDIMNETHFFKTDSVATFLLSSFPFARNFNQYLMTIELKNSLNNMKLFQYSVVTIFAFLFSMCDSQEYDIKTILDKSFSFLNMRNGLQLESTVVVWDDVYKTSTELPKSCLLYTSDAADE